MIKIRFLLRLAAVISAITFLCSCPGQPQEIPLSIRSACQYDSINGMALVTSAAWNNPEPGAQAPQSVEIVFSFTPDTPGRKPAYRFPAVPDQNQGARIHLEAGYLERGRREIVPGGTVRCVRNEIKSGTCTPVVFSFPDYEIPR